MKSEVIERIRQFAETVALNRGRAYIVGGTIRDEFIGIESKDIDIEVHGIPAKPLRKIIESHFPNVEDIGEVFGVLHTIVDGVEIDISLPRRDSSTGPGHKGFDVNVDPDMSPEDALRRRDFTINAMLKDILSGEIIDPFGGREDLEKRILRPVDSETFGEDPLRVLRAVQLVARLELTVPGDVLELLRSISPQLSELSADRHRDEWRKLFLKARRPSLGLHLAKEIGAFDALPIVQAMKETEQEPEWHPEGDVWIHTGMVCDVAAEVCEREILIQTDRLVVMLGAFCHDLGKPETTQVIDDRVRSHKHSHAGLKHTEDVLAFFGFPGLIDVVTPLVHHHLEPYQLYLQLNSESPPGDGAIRSLARRLHPATIDQLLFVAESDMRGRGPFPNGNDQYRMDSLDWLRDRAHELEIRDRKPEDIIRGRDLLALGMKPGSHFGLIVKAANLFHDEVHVERARIMDIVKRSDMSSVSSVDDALELFRKNQDR
jgi:tRNA nucleotidyltransferase (CCA-adding enzyme)